MVSVIVPARDAAATLPATLEALAGQTYAGEVEVIVVDDGSTDETQAICRASAVRPRVVRNEQALGAGAARNAGVAVASGAVLAFTDADCAPRPDWVAAGVRALDGAALVQGAVKPDPAVPWGPYHRSVEVVAETGYYQTANLFVRREVFERVGGFRDFIVASGGEGLLGWRAAHGARASREPLGEDMQFGWQVRREGLRTVFAPEALVYHAVFELSPQEWIRYRWRWARHMPGVAARAPELRRTAFYRRWFFDGRTARFDAALVGVVSAVACRRMWPLVLALPYSRYAVGEAARWGWPRAGGVLAVSVAADAVGAAALVTGSAAWRSPLF
jgi:glycosyltransferase involved in cell wall biosynthesis